MKSIFYLPFLALFISCNKVTDSNIKELHKKYMTASINHDIKTLSLMTHDSIVWKLGPYLLKGKEAALGPNKYDKGTNCILDYSNVKVHGDTVEFELVERNEVLSSMGMEGVTQYPRFIFKNGLLYKKEFWKPSSDIQEIARRSKQRREWIKINHPEIFEKFFNSQGNFIFNEENGELQVQMAKEWKEALKE